ncbi:MAG: hypothetical protein COA47_14410 [Robiginitomaculum sp.]|nr:MAG: hypothetical protein COA47_14410 [Robiginitomaculum sp.]
MRDETRKHDRKTLRFPRSDMDEHGVLDDILASKYDYEDFSQTREAYDAEDKRRSPISREEIRSGAYARRIAALDEKYWASKSTVRFGGIGELRQRHGTVLGQEAEFISNIRKSIVLIVGANDLGRISLASNSYRWPFAPNTYCCQGLVLAPGVIVGYLTEQCDCFENSYEHNRPISYAVFDEMGDYKLIYGSAYYDLRHPKQPVRKNGANAYLFSARAEDTKNRIPAIRQTPLQEGEELYSIGINQGIWLVSSGEFIRMDGKNVVTNCNVYHGSCGAPLFDQLGKLVGWGAKLLHNERSSVTTYTQRQYDVGRFLRISELYTHLANVKEHLEPAQINFP